MEQLDSKDMVYLSFILTYWFIFYLWHIAGNLQDSDIYHGIIASKEQRGHCRLQIDDWRKREVQMCITHTTDRAEVQTLAKIWRQDQVDQLV